MRLVKLVNRKFIEFFERFLCFIMATNSHFLPAIDKLLGRVNYMSWKFAVKAYLEHEGFWNCIFGTEVNQEKLIKA